MSLPRILGLFLAGSNKKEETNKSQFKPTKETSYTPEELLTIVNQLPEESPTFRVTSATVDFLTATSLVLADIRNNNKGFLNSDCIYYLNDMGAALLEAKQTLLETAPNKDPELNDAISYCETIIHKRLKALKPDDKFSKAYQQDNSLKSALSNIAKANYRLK